VNALMSHIVDLKRKITLLVTNYENIKEENLKLRNDKYQMGEVINGLEQEVKDLKKRVEVVDLVQGVDLKDKDAMIFARKRVNNLIRDIDKCISLLNE
jgi:predicted nuclease with TOPRIM domain